MKKYNPLLEYKKSKLIPLGIQNNFTKEERDYWNSILMNPEQLNIDEDDNLSDKPEFKKLLQVFKSKVKEFVSNLNSIKRIILRTYYQSKDNKFISLKILINGNFFRFSTVEDFKKEVYKDTSRHMDRLTKDKKYILWYS